MVFLPSLSLLLFCFKKKEGEDRRDENLPESLGFPAVRKLLFVSDFLAFCYTGKRNRMMHLHLMRTKC